MKLRIMTAVLGTAAMLAAWGVTPPTTADVWAAGGGNGGAEIDAVGSNASGGAADSSR